MKKHINYLVEILKRGIWMQKKDKVYEVLRNLAIDYKVVTHPAVFTSAEAEQYRTLFEGARCKNLFLRNGKGDTHYLVIIDQAKDMHLRELALELGEKRLGFASPERLERYLGLTPGSVSVFGLISNIDKNVVVVIDEDLQKEEKINFHPNINTETLTILYSDLLKFLRWTGNRVIIQRL